MRRNMKRLAAKLAMGAIAVTRPPHRGRAFGVAFISTCAALAAIVAMNAYGATAAPAAHKTHHRANKYYPPLLEEWGINGPFGQKGIYVKYGMIMSYPGGLFVDYPQLGRRDIIPIMRVKLVMPTGMKLLNPKSGPLKSKFSDALYWSVYHKRTPKSNLRWFYKRGIPTWQVSQLSEGNLPRVFFWVSGQPGQCFYATDQGFYHKKLRRKKHIVRVLAPIPHSPVDKTPTSCLPTPPGSTTPTTTTTSTTPSP